MVSVKRCTRLRPKPASLPLPVSEAFFVQKTDLIAELKRTKDIPGIKKFKVEMAQVEKTQEQNLISEINKAFSVSNFVDQVGQLYYIERTDQV